MPRLEYFIVCESVVLDTSTNQVTLFNVLEDIFPEQFPDELRRVEAVSLWNLESGEENIDFQAILRVTPPGYISVDFSMNLSKGRMKYRAVMALSFIPLKEAGTLVFEVLLNGKHSASHSVSIHDAGTKVFWEDLNKNAFSKANAETVATSKTNGPEIQE